MNQIQKIVKLQEKISGQACTCASINERINRIVSEEIDHEGVCCPKCCNCLWDRLHEELIRSDY